MQRVELYKEEHPTAIQDKMTKEINSGWKVTAVTMTDGGIEVPYRYTAIVVYEKETLKSGLVSGVAEAKRSYPTPAFKR
jgi:hypothetical protein